MKIQKISSRASVAVTSLCVCAWAYAQDATVGKSVFAQCVACHAVNGTNGVGPSLQGIVGRKSGSFPGFRYSHAMKSAGVVWNDKTLDAYIAEPQRAVPGNVMPYSGLVDAKQRADLIAYLKTIR